MPFLSRGRGDSKALGNGALSAGAGVIGFFLSSVFSFLAWLVLCVLVVGFSLVGLRLSHF